MGGKKKKSAAQAPAVAAERRNGAASGSAVTGSGEEPTKQTATNKPQKSSKESKSKAAPKTYSLTNTAQVEKGGVSEKSILTVCIQADLEKKIIKLINDFRQENGDKGPISGRLTTKKLLGFCSKK
ncbi:hypothetical protein OJAV_G00121680 [Oryzias javanicus]|uniref:Uncharacterized protein n=1 Tax=Oryzias javanicus TaxID=123683 RepID=A0A437CSS3_ORYJA|nr:hypothetical protein OJAV_G00121680 [Oryzias javanicus]